MMIKDDAEAHKQYLFLTNQNGLIALLKKEQFSSLREIIYRKLLLILNLNTKSILNSVNSFSLRYSNIVEQKTTIKG